MKKIAFLSVIVVLQLFFLLDLCGAGEYDIRFDEQTKLTEDTVFSGTVYIKDKIYVSKGATLTIKPGTVIKFGRPGLADDGNVDFSIKVEGRIIAVGSAAKPIIFTSASLEEQSSFGEVYLNEASDSIFEYCYFTYSHWALHLHDSNVTVKNCTFKDTFGGIRFKGDKVIARSNKFINNIIAFRFWQASPEISGNIFKGNTTAIFIREQAKAPVITGNTFIGTKEYFIKLGELQEGDISISGNDFNTAKESDISEKIFDKDDEEYLGKVHINVN